MIKSQFEVEVLVNGKPLKEYFKDGRIYVEGRKETRFSLRLRNNSGMRKLFVPSIDGLSVMSGEECSFNSGGYIVPAYNSVTIEGWRVSDEKVAEFYFSSKNDSYRKRMGKGNNLGVIGVAVFHEKFQSWARNNVISTTYRSRPFDFPPKNAFYCSSGSTSFSSQGLASGAGMSGVNGATMMNASLGTGWGDEKRSEVTTVEFERGETPTDTFTIYYNTREQLEAMGVNFKKEPVYVVPQAFPGQYCKPPQN